MEGARILRDGKDDEDDNYSGHDSQVDSILEVNHFSRPQFEIQRWLPGEEVVLKSDRKGRSK